MLSDGHDVSSRRQRQSSIHAADSVDTTPAGSRLRRHRRAYRNLAVVRLAQLIAVLPCHVDQMLTLFWEIPCRQ